MTWCGNTAGDLISYCSWTLITQLVNQMKETMFMMKNSTSNALEVGSVTYTVKEFGSHNYSVLTLITQIIFGERISCYFCLVKANSNDKFTDI